MKIGLILILSILIATEFLLVEFGGYTIGKAHSVWVPDNGFIVIEKSFSESYGTFLYKTKDAYPESQKGEYPLYIRTNKNWNTGDTIYLSK